MELRKVTSGKHDSKPRASENNSHWLPETYNPSGFRWFQNNCGRHTCTLTGTHARSRVAPFHHVIFFFSPLQTFLKSRLKTSLGSETDWKDKLFHFLGKCVFSHTNSGSKRTTTVHIPIYPNQHTMMCCHRLRIKDYWFLLVAFDLHRTAM